MSKTSFDFETAAIKAEQLAQSNLSIYKMKLIFYALLGYGMIFVVLISLCGLVAGLIGMAFVSTALFLLLIKKKLILVVLPAIWILLRSLWIRFESPTGYLLTRQKFPILFNEIDQLRNTLKAPKIHQVILTPELNAAVSQIPRLGILGWHKNTLILGLELLLILSPEQARAVLAHEFGHLSSNHSRFNGWIYRLRLTWYRIMEAFEHQEALGAKIMRRFFNWYAPRFAAYSFALARTNEYEADMISTQLTSNDLTSQALINTHVTGPYIDHDYWQEFFKKADEMPEPKPLPWYGLSCFLKEHKPAMAQLKEKLEEELKRKTAYDDTHPALQDRIKALKVSSLLTPQPVEITAAQAWFSNQLQNVIEDFDRDWLEYNGSRWKARYDYVCESKKTLTKLNEKETATLNDEALWQKAGLTEQFGQKDEAFALFQAYQSRHPNDPDVAFVLGRMLFNQNDEDCLAQMKKALTEPGLVIEACQYAYYFLANQNRSEEAQWWIQQAQVQIRIDEISKQERASLAVEDMLIKIHTNEAFLSHITKKLKGYKNIKKAWIAKKQVQYYTEVPALAIAIVFKGFFLSYEQLANKIAEDLVQDPALNCSLFIVPKGGDYKKLARRIIQVGDKII